MLNKAKTRSVISGKSKFGTLSDKRFPYDGPSHTEAFHDWPKSLGVKHLYDPDIKMGHWYYRGWVDPVMELLNSLVEEDNVDNTGDDSYLKSTMKQIAKTQIRCLQTKMSRGLPLRRVLRVHGMFLSD